MFCGPHTPRNEIDRRSDSRGLIVFMAGLLLAWVGGAAAAEPAAAAKVPIIRIGVEFNSPPLSFADDTGQPTGFTPELLHEMEATGLVKFEVIAESWSFISTEFEAGRLDALANVVRTEARKASMEFSIAHASLHGLIYTRPGDPLITRTAQFAGKKMATLKGTMSHLNALNHQGWGATIVADGDWNKVLLSVKNGECDFALLSRRLMFEQPDEMGLHREFVEDVIHPFHMVVHPGDRDNLEAINEALAVVRQNGKFDRLHAKWVGPIEPHPIRWNDLRPYLAPAVMLVLLVGALFLWQQAGNRRLRQHAQALQASEEKYRVLVEHTTEGIFVVQDGVFKFVNVALARMAGMTVDKLLGRSFLEFLPAKDHATVLDNQRQLINGELKLHREEYDIHLPTGQTLFLMTSTVRIDWQGRPATLSLASDVTEIHQAEAGLQQSLREKEALLKEVHHRVKNNLQVITSLLRLEAAKWNDPAAKAVLTDMQSRIRSMALLHETLYRTGNFTRVDLAGYLRELGTQLFRGQNSAPERVQLELQLAAVMVEIDQAIPCGLIVNELLTNALKHGFPGGMSGKIRVRLSQTADDQVQVRISDTGVGLPAGLNPTQLDSLGLRLVSDLTRQLQGTLTIGAGAQFDITFKPRFPMTTSSNPFPPPAP